MLLNPLSNRTTFEIDEAEQVASSWWVFLLAGVISVVFGALILAIDWTVNGLAAFVGTLFIIQGAAYLITKPLDGGTRSTNVIAGLLGIAAGIALLVWPGRGLYVLAVFIGAWIIVSGVMHIVGALANRQAPHWWLVLILIIALIVFGPSKLPEIGKSLGKVMGEFRRATGDFQRTIEQEVEAVKALEPPEAPPPTPVTEPPAAAAEPVLTPAADTVAHGASSETPSKA